MGAHALRPEFSLLGGKGEGCYPPAYGYHAECRFTAR